MSSIDFSFQQLATTGSFDSADTVIFARLQWKCVFRVVSTEHGVLGTFQYKDIVLPAQYFQLLNYKIIKIALENIYELLK